MVTCVHSIGHLCAIERTQVTILGFSKVLVVS